MASSEQDSPPTDSEDGRKDADSLLNKMNSAMSAVPAPAPAASASAPASASASSAKPADDPLTQATPAAPAPAPFKAKKATFTRTIHEFAALGSSGLLYPKPPEFSASSAAPETPDVSIYQSIDNAIEARNKTPEFLMPGEAGRPVQSSPQQVQPMPAPMQQIPPSAQQQFLDSQSGSAQYSNGAAEQPSQSQSQYPLAQYPQYPDSQGSQYDESSQLAQVHSQYPEVQFELQPPNQYVESENDLPYAAEVTPFTHPEAYAEEQQPKEPKAPARNLASSIAAINRAKEIKKTTALSKALERDKAWLEAKDLPAERDAIDAQLLAARERALEAQPAEPQHVTRTDFAAIIDKAPKDLPTPSIFQKAMDYAGKHPIPIGLSIVVLLAVIGFVDLQSLQAASRQVQKGADLLAHGDTKAAIAALDQAVALNDTNADAYLFRGKAYARSGNTDKALENFKRALKLDPKSLEALSQSAIISLSLERYKEAEGYFLQYNKFSGGGPKPIEILTGLGRAYLGSRQNEQALEQFNRAAELKPGDAEILSLRATAYLRTGRPVEAILDCSNAIKINPKSYSTYVLRARCYQRNKNKPKAMADFAQAISLDPKNPDAFVARGEFYIAQKDFERALKDFGKAIALNPQDEKAYEGRARLYLAKGDKAKAEQDYDAIAAVPGFKPSLAYTSGRADLYMQTGNWQKAIALLKKAQVKDAAHDAEYSLQLADCYGGLKQYAKAATACEKTVASQPTNANAMMKHGQYSYLAGNKITGRAGLFKAIELDPNNANAYLQRGDYYLAEKQLGSASEDFKRALKLEPDLSAASENLAFCQSQVKTVKVARAGSTDTTADGSSLSKAEIKEIADSSDPKSLQNKGYEALKAGRTQYALVALTRAVQLSPNNAAGRRYLSHTMAAMGDGAGAYQQFLAWEKLESVSATEEINFARALMSGGDAGSAKTMFTHIVTKFNSDTAVLLNVATLCAQAHFIDEATVAINAGERIASGAERAQFERIQSTLGGTFGPSGPAWPTEHHPIDGKGRS